MKKNKNNLLIFLFFSIIFSLIYFLAFPSKLLEDSLWNFQSIFKMANYGAIYNVNNVIHTPIYFEIGNIFFKILGNNFFAYSWLQVILFFSEFILFYIIFRKLKINIWNSLLNTQIMFFLVYSYLKTDANYNILSSIFTFIGIIIYLKKYNTKSYNYLQGLIIFLTLFSKQTIGVYYAIAIVVFDIIKLGIKKDFFFSQLKKLSTFLPLFIISLIVMYFRGNLFNFINLCFGSIFEFGNSNISFGFSCIPYIIFIILVIAFSFILIFAINKINEEQQNNITFLLCLSIFLSFNMLPLVNKYHILISCVYYFILFLYELEFAVFSELLSEKIVKKIIILVFILLSAKVMFDYFDYHKDLETFPKDSPFYPSQTSSGSVEKINILTQYIQDKKENNTTVLVLSNTAGLYMIPLGINNYEFDMLLSGNLGYNGIQKSIDKISNMKNTEFLIFTNEEDCHWQEPKEIREYIMSNFKKTGEILDYSIYFNN